MIRPIKKGVESFKPKRNVSSVSFIVCLRAKLCEAQPPHALNDPAATTNGVTGSSAQDDQKHPESSARDESPVSLACTPGELLIAHSKVYIFAVQFLCSELKELALQRLTQVFGSADPKASDVLSGLSEAIILIYDKTQEQISAAEPARALLMNFLAQYLEYLDDVGTLLLLESQELIGDLVQETLKRATTAERTVEELSEEGAHKDKKLQKLKSSRCKRCRSHASPELESQEWS
jgi:hypothetical protein